MSIVLFPGNDSIHSQMVDDSEGYFMVHLKDLRSSNCTQDSCSAAKCSYLKQYCFDRWQCKAPKVK